MSADYGYNELTVGDDEPMKIKQRVVVSEIRILDKEAEVTFETPDGKGFLALTFPAMVGAAFHVTQEFVLLLSEVRTIKAEE